MGIKKKNTFIYVDNDVCVKDFYYLSKLNINWGKSHLLVIGQDVITLLII